MNTPLAAPAQQPFAKDLRGLSTEALTSIAGVLAASAVVALNVGIQRVLDLDLLGLTYAFIFPVGAFIGGLGAALGYYAAARLTQTLPSRRMLLEMLAIAVSTWLLMHWVEYATLRLDDGRMASDAVPFWDYLRIRTEHLQLVMQGSAPGADTTPELGLLGYVHELIQIAGFLLGAFLVWQRLKIQEACTPCSRYARSQRLLQRAATQVFDDLLQRCGVVIADLRGRVAGVVGNHHLVGMNLSIVTCPSCGRSWMRPAAIVFDRGHAIARQLDAHALTPTQAAAMRSFAPTGD